MEYKLIIKSEIKVLSFHANLKIDLKLNQVQKIFKTKIEMSAENIQAPECERCKLIFLHRDVPRRLVKKKNSAKTEESLRHLEV